METFHSAVLGLIQGLTEFLPISSSGHLIILRWLFGWEEHGILFDVILHGGTLCALLIYFRRDWISILRPGRTRLFWHLLVASIPAVIFAGIAAGRFENYFRNPTSVALMLGVFGLLLYIADLYGRKDKSMAEMTWRLCLLIGFSQVLAIFPGVSRSGITISAGLALGMDRESSVRFSFLLSAPIVFAAFCYGMKELTGVGDSLPMTAILAGFLAAFASGISAIHFLLKFIRQKRFTPFVIYRLAASVIVLIIIIYKG